MILEFGIVYRAFANQEQDFKTDTISYAPIKYTHVVTFLIYLSKTAEKLSFMLVQTQYKKSHY